MIGPGPYICSESSGGGFPIWLLMKKNVNLKHINSAGKIEFDTKYMNYCKEWYQEVIPLIKYHQITETNNGCIIGFQIENEYFESEFGVREYIKKLIDYARELGITVPIFHNDFKEKEPSSWKDLVDLTGFDKYAIFAPRECEKLPLPNWSTRHFSERVDRLENKVRTDKRSEPQTPMFIPELQGGWYNHWGIAYGYDDLYDFYGSVYQKTLEQSVAAQGVTMMSLYMFYGGTSWGALSNPEVYTSYDYSAAIREYGYQSAKLRHLRLFNLFAQTFIESFACSNYTKKIDIECDKKGILFRQRTSIDGTNFYFFRNFNKEGDQSFLVKLPEGLILPKEGTHFLKLRDSFIAIGNHTIKEFYIRFCSLYVILKGTIKGNPLIVCINNGGELILKGNNFTVKGDIFKADDMGFTRIWCEKECFASIINENNNILNIICLSEENALSLNADISGPEISVAWGAYSFFYNNNHQLEIESLGSQTIYLLSSKDTISGFQNIGESYNLDIKKCVLGSAPKFPELILNQWQQIKTRWDETDDNRIWKRYDFKNFDDSIDLGFMCGHILYKCEFSVSTIQNLNLELNIRHKCGIWLNNFFIGGHYTYDYDSGKAGAMDGEDPIDQGSVNYDLSEFLVLGKNTLFIITENLGQMKTFFVNNNARVPRGIISAEFSDSLEEEEWFISGRNVTELNQIFETSGLPGEIFSYHLGESDKYFDIGSYLRLLPEDKITWYKTTFNWSPATNIRAPLKVHIEGNLNANIYLNGVYIGRYWGEFGPQYEFFMMDGLLEKENVLVLACWTLKETELVITVEPYEIDLESGNLKKNSVKFLIEKHILDI